jgi:Protein of unknown function (DUF1329)
MKLSSAVFAAVLGFACLIGPARTQALDFNEQNFKQLTDVDSRATIPAGTRITVNNWKEYSRFMPVWMQAAYSGEYVARIGSSPDFAIVVEPTVHYPLPQKFLEDTEKYGNQTRLVPLPDGGFTWAGYVAGLPFPNPSEPNAGVKILYNTWAKFLPWAVHFWSDGALVDRFGNRSFQRVDAGWYRTSHISYPGIAPGFSFAPGVLYTTRFMVESPEQSKYTTEMTLQTDDPTKLQEVYVFLPSIRRSLRLSSAAHCAPVLGTDYVQDDDSWLPSNYHVAFLGEKKLLQIVPDPDPNKGYKMANWVGMVNNGQWDEFPGWPRAGTGAAHWMLRNFYVLDLTWLPSKGAYCFSHRIYYIDTDSWMNVMNESYDRDGKLWKLLWDGFPPLPYRGQRTMVYGTSISTMGIDFQNTHASTAISQAPTFEDDVPIQYRNMEVVTSPSGLAQIMK